jgi:predicted RNA-binding Zn ribbon-like protein
VPVEPVVLGGCDPSVLRSINLLVSFVSSTASRGGRPEQLGNETDFAAWVHENGLGETGEQPTDADAAVARELRAALIGVFRAHCDCATAPVGEAESYLRRAARRYPVAAAVDAKGCRFEAVQPGVPGVFGTILAAAADAAAQGSWPRLKMCKNATCYAGFYDKTRNQSGQFCSSACNSQASMRAYRERQKSA